MPFERARTLTVLLWVAAASACSEPVDRSPELVGPGGSTGQTGGSGGRGGAAGIKLDASVPATGLGGAGGTAGSGGTGGTGGTAGTGGSAGAGGSGGMTTVDARPSTTPDAGTSVGGMGGSAGMGGAGGTGGAITPGKSGTVPTAAELKVAFIGDTNSGANYAAVMALIKKEGAQAVAVAGDMTYSANPTSWWDATDAGLGKDFPVFIARGNHDDSSWAGFLPRQKDHMGGAERTAGPHDAAHLTVFKGLAIATIKKGDRAAVVQNLLKGSDHIWKVCLWHQNQNKLQVGGKGDEMGYDVYDACRALGAIIINGHEHTYHRTKTLTNMATHAVDSTCSDGAKLCVGPGRSFVTVSGMGGTGIRAQVRCLPSAPMAPFPSLNTEDATCKIWASIYTKNQGGNYGAQFITFNVDGDPRKAKGYFKSINGQTVDTFEIKAD